MATWGGTKLKDPVELLATSMLSLYVIDSGAPKAMWWRRAVKRLRRAAGDLDPVPRNRQTLAGVVRLRSGSAWTLTVTAAFRARRVGGWGA